MRFCRQEYYSGSLTTIRSIRSCLRFFFDDAPTFDVRCNMLLGSGQPKEKGESGRNEHGTKIDALGLVGSKSLLPPSSFIPSQSRHANDVGEKRCWLFIFIFLLSQVSREGVDVSDYVTDWISPLSIPPLCAPFAPITSLFAIPARLLLRDDAFHINIHWFVEIGALTHFCLQNFNLAEPLFSLV